MDRARIEVLLDGRINHLVLLDQTLTHELLGLDAHSKVIATGAHKVVDTRPTTRQVRLNQFLNDN